MQELKCWRFAASFDVKSVKYIFCKTSAFIMEVVAEKLMYL